LGAAAKPTRENRTITLGFRDEATYCRLLGDRKAPCQGVRRGVCGLTSGAVVGGKGRVIFLHSEVRWHSACPSSCCTAETISTYAVLSLATRACHVLLQTARTPRQGPMSKKILHTAHTCTIVSLHAQQCALHCRSHKPLATAVLTSPQRLTAPLGRRLVIVDKYGIHCRRDTLWHRHL